MKKLGIYAGSFDPIHEGHISFADLSMQQLNLETVVFMPERFPRNKPYVTPVSERLSELEITLRNTPFAILDAQSDTFTTSETLPELEEIYPNTDFVFLLGSDVVLSMPNWANIERLQSYDFAVGMRDEQVQEEITEMLDRLDLNYTLILSPYGHISSSKIRALR